MVWVPSPSINRGESSINQSALFKVFRNNQFTTISQNNIARALAMAATAGFRMNASLVEGHDNIGQTLVYLNVLATITDMSLP